MTIDIKSQRLALSAIELRHLTGWSDSLIEDYLNIFTDFQSLIGITLEDITTSYSDNSIVFVKQNALKQDNANFTWNNLTKEFKVNGALSGSLSEAIRQEAYFLGTL